MGLKKMVMIAAVLALSAPAFASSRVEEALTLNETPVTKKTSADKNKPSKAKAVFDTLNTTSSDTQKTELPKNARHDATAGVFI